MGALIRPALATLAMLLSLGGARAETHIYIEGSPFCEGLASFRAMIAAMLAHDRAAVEGLDYCTSLKAGVPVDVVRSLAQLTPGSRIVEVRVHGAGGIVSGYMLSNDLDDATPDP